MWHRFLCRMSFLMQTSPGIYFSSNPGIFWILSMKIVIYKVSEDEDYCFLSCLLCFPISLSPHSLSHLSGMTALAWAFLFLPVKRVFVLPTFDWCLPEDNHLILRVFCLQYKAPCGSCCCNLTMHEKNWIELNLKCKSNITSREEFKKLIWKKYIFNHWVMKSICMSMLHSVWVKWFSQFTKNHSSSFD